MLLQATRDGDLQVVLRLLYTNPFINRQELRDALWESVRCNRLEVLRSLLEFRVDPSSAPSTSLSQPPATLRHLPWTPLLALAVNGAGRAEDRADLVAELLRADRCTDDGKQQSPPSTQSSQQFVRAPTSMIEAKTYSDRSPSIKGSDKPSADSSILKERGLLASVLDEPIKRGYCVAASSENAAVMGDFKQRLSSCGSEDLVSVESQLEELLRSVRSERQERLERQLQSVQRRHKQESRDRQELEEGQICAVCSESEKTILFMPCRHLCTCENCAAQLNLCPICRAPIAEKVKCIRP